MAVSRLVVLVAVLSLTVIVGTAAIANLMVRPSETPSKSSTSSGGTSTTSSQPSAPTTTPIATSTTTTSTSTTSSSTTTASSPPTQPVTSTSTTTSVPPPPSGGQGDLQLILSLNSTTIASGATIGITVSDYNPTSSTLNLSKGSDWAVNGLGTGWCPSLYFPFGIAVLQGVYTAANVSQAKPLEIFPMVACPMIVMYIEGYSFQPMSDNASIIPGGGVATMATGISATGTYGAAGSEINQFSPFAPGTYTIVAGDEWGNLVFAYFTVVSS